MQLHGTTHFLQDGAPCHKSRIVMEWFNNIHSIGLIRWPGNSPDPNPIENVWAWMKNQLADTNCKNMDEWKREITRLWVTKMDDCQYMRYVVESMPRRFQQVIFCCLLGIFINDWSRLFEDIVAVHLGPLCSVMYLAHGIYLHTSQQNSPPTLEMSQTFTIMFWWRSVGCNEPYPGLG
jgi:hypothetical protein